jgi:DNA polymerase III delta subunit
LEKKYNKANVVHDLASLLFFQEACLGLISPDESKKEKALKAFELFLPEFESCLIEFARAGNGTCEI